MPGEIKFPQVPEFPFELEFASHSLIQDKVLNHKDSTVGGIYDRHTYDKEKRLALETWANHLQTFLSGENRSTNVVDLWR